MQQRFRGVPEYRARIVLSLLNLAVESRSNRPPTDHATLAECERTILARYFLRGTSGASTRDLRSQWGCGLGDVAHPVAKRNQGIHHGHIPLTKYWPRRTMQSARRSRPRHRVDLRGREDAVGGKRDAHGPGCDLARPHDRPCVVAVGPGEARTGVRCTLEPYSLASVAAVLRCDANRL